MLAGDFTAFASPACNAGRAIALRTPFVNNRVDPALFSPAAKNLSARLPKTEDPCGELIYGRKSDNDDIQIIGKMDYQKSEVHSLFGRVLLGYNNSPSPFKFTPDNVLNAAQDTVNKEMMLTVGS